MTQPLLECPPLHFLSRSKTTWPPALRWFLLWASVLWAHLSPHPLLKLSKIWPSLRKLRISLRKIVRLAHPPLYPSHTNLDLALGQAFFILINLLIWSLFSLGFEESILANLKILHSSKKSERAPQNKEKKKYLILVWILDQLQGGWIVVEEKFSICNAELKQNQN